MYPALRDALTGKTVLVYNAAYDTERLHYTCKAYGLPDVIDVAADWTCVMELYAQWYGDWSDYWKSYRWQPLGSSGHRAIDDCRVALDRVRQMAEAKLSDETESEESHG